MSVNEKRKILICDDQIQAERSWAKRIEAVPGLTEHFEIEVMEPLELLSASKGLERRRSIARSGQQYTENPEAEEIAVRKIDATDVLIIDYDLLDLSEEYYQTGEGIAYLARCYSQCSFIIALNQFDHGSTAFDLRMTGHIQSFADLNIGDPAIANDGLWHPSWFPNETKFRPWAWPLIPLAVDKYEKRASELVSHLDEPILSYFEFPDVVVNAMPRTVLEFITASTDNPLKTTFRMFAEPGEYGSNEGLRRKDQVTSDEALARIAAARISHWLEHVVLPGQHLLVDAPHLVMRYPSLLSGDPEDINMWNTTATLNNDIPIESKIIESSRFSQADWLSRPAWYWTTLSKYKEIEEVRDPWSAETPKFVFCEDTSTFAAREEVQEYVSDLNTVSSPFVRRFVKKVEKVVYKPTVRFSM